MSIRLCIGDYAKKGYEPANMGCRIYCLEELCFFIRENAGLLDENFVSEELIRWLDRECGLDELARELEKAGKKNHSLKNDVDLILGYSGFYSGEIRNQILQDLAENNQLSVFERRKARADAFARRKEYRMAGREYGGLLRQLPPQERKLRGEIYHACGVCLAELFYFELAGTYFARAYKLTGQMSSYRQYLWTKRLSMTKEAYGEYLEEHREAYEEAQVLEEERKALIADWKNSDYARDLEELREQEAPELLIRRIDELKDEYRLMTGRMRGQDEVVE